MARGQLLQPYRNTEKAAWLVFPMAASNQEAGHRSSVAQSIHRNLRYSRIVERGR